MLVIVFPSSILKSSNFLMVIVNLLFLCYSSPSPISIRFSHTSLVVFQLRILEKIVSSTTLNMMSLAKLCRLFLFLSSMIHSILGFGMWVGASASLVVGLTFMTTKGLSRITSSISSCKATRCAYMRIFQSSNLLKENIKFLARVFSIFFNMYTF